MFSVKSVKSKKSYTKENGTKERSWIVGWFDGWIVGWPID